MTDNLSAEQKSVLLWLLDYCNRIESSGNDHAKQDIALWGVPWRTNGLTRSEHASLSRTLRRLETRGLVIRKNDVSDGRRTTGVVLTANGRQIAEAVNIAQK